MENKKLYINIDDYQGGTFALGRIGTLKKWREQAMDWCYMDDNYELYNLLKYYKIKNDRLIEVINDIWSIDIVEYDKNVNYDLELYFME